MPVNLNFGLYAITDPLLLNSHNLLSSVEAALSGGCKVVQYRDKLATANEQLQRARALRTLCSQYQAQLIINDNVQLCLDSEADGVHLGKSDGDILKAKKILGDSRILGVTCHSDLAYAQSCIDAGADYCAFGRLFPSNTKPDAPPCSTAMLAKALKLSKPIVGIGGITLDNIESLMQTSLQHAAVIHGLFSATDIKAHAEQFQAYFSQS